MTHRILGRTGIRVSPLARIDAISPPGRATVPFYEAAFGPNARW